MQNAYGDLEGLPENRWRPIEGKWPAIAGRFSFGLELI